jgi:hypothetical protein
MSSQKLKVLLSETKISGWSKVENISGKAVKHTGTVVKMSASTFSAMIFTDCVGLITNSATLVLKSKTHKSSSML